MFGFHPFSTQPQVSIVPFLDVQTTTNVVTSSIGTAVPESRIIATTAGILNSAIQVAGAEYTFTATFIPESNLITVDLKTASIFTYVQVDDNIVDEGSGWTEVVTESTTESWSDV